MITGRVPRFLQQILDFLECLESMLFQATSVKVFLNVDALLSPLFGGRITPPQHLLFFFFFFATFLCGSHFFSEQVGKKERDYGLWEGQNFSSQWPVDKTTSWNFKKIQIP